VLARANEAYLYALCSLSRCVEEECGLETLNETARKRGEGGRGLGTANKLSSATVRPQRHVYAVLHQA
jgi:hypothetical protein